MALHLHRARRADVLADGLAGLLATPQPDPFATEVVVVPARGMERWLSQRLSHVLGRADGRSDGVCAGVEFRTPWSLVAEISGTAAPIAAIGAAVLIVMVGIKAYRWVRRAM